MTKVKNFKNYIPKQITVDEYFVAFYNFPKGLLAGFTHDDIKKNISFVKRVKCDEVTREEIFRGEVLLVKDINGRVLAYKNPFVSEMKYNSDILYAEDYDKTLESIDKKLERYFDECKDNDKICFTLDEDIDIVEKTDKSCLESMSNYELHKILKDARGKKDYSMMRIVQRVLWFRTENHQEAKRKAKARILKKEIREDDIYGKY